eukprot:SAG31_NODE_3565_length_4119_cov_108.823383_1_plen_82_part_00
MFKLSDELEHERISAFTLYLSCVQRLAVPCAKVMTTFVSFVSINNNIVYANVDSWSTLVVCLFVAIDTVFFFYIRRGSTNF